MREIRSKIAPSASETTKVAAIVGETEKQETSEDLEETTDMPEETIEIATVATETEASEDRPSLTSGKKVTTFGVAMADSIPWVIVPSIAHILS